MHSFFLHITRWLAYFLFFMALGNLFAKDMSTHKVFSKIKANNTKNFGKKIKAKLHSSLLSIQLKNIPKEMIDFKKKPELYLVFRKGKKPKLILENVSPFYNNFFIIYEDILQKSGLFLGIDDYQDFKSFSKKYEVTFTQKNNEDIKMSVKEKDGLHGDYAIFYYRNDYQLKHVDFYEKKKLAAVVKFFFAKVNNKNLPSRIVVELQKGAQKADHFMVDLSDYKF